VIDARVSTACDRVGTENKAPRSNNLRQLKSYGKGSLFFAPLGVGYELTLSNHFDDALPTACELNSHFANGALSLFEFQHSLNRPPLWLCLTTGIAPRAGLSNSSNLCYRRQNLARHTCQLSLVSGCA